MNCLEFRRRMETEPADPGQDARAHAAACPACATFQRRAARFDEALRGAARVAPPENLDARILMRQSFRTPRRRLRRGLAWPALAAGIVLALAAALYVGRAVHDESGLHQELVALVNAADYAMAARGPVSGDALGDALRPVGLELREALDDVSFAGRCLVRGRLSGHLVLRESAAPVTVFLMPGEHVMRTSRFDLDGWHGMVVPAGRGSVGIVAPRGEALDAGLVDRLLQAVRWPA